MVRRTLDSRFPFADVLNRFLTEYRECRTYWYVQTARTLTDAESIAAIMRTIHDDFRDEEWTRDTQDALLRRLVRAKVLAPYKPGAALADRTALVREWKKLLEMLGFMWVQPNKHVVVTDAGLDLLTTDSPSSVIEAQIAKIQYPNPSLETGYASDFKGLLPHLFLLQILQRCSYKLDVEELELFLNLAQEQDNVEMIARYIQCWRDLQDDEKKTIRQIVKSTKMRGAANTLRSQRIRQNSSYQRALHTYPAYIEERTEEGKREIVCRLPQRLNQLIAEELPRLKISTFVSLEEWIAYFGDPDQRPSWYTYLTLSVEKAKSKRATKAAKRLIEQHSDQVSTDEKQDLIRRQIEKDIENFYAKNLHLIEKGLKLERQQYPTAIGPIDMLCKDASGRFVVVEVKAEEARDSVFGQVLRYIGWVHRNLDGGNKNVRGVILARAFPETARYSRIGLGVLSDDYEDFLKFKAFSL